MTRATVLRRFACVSTFLICQFLVACPKSPGLLRGGDCVFGPDGPCTTYTEYDTDGHARSVQTVCLAGEGFRIYHYNIFGQVSRIETDCGATVPLVTGMTRSTAESTITAEGLRVGSVTPNPDASAPPGQVISQTPDAGVRLLTGTSVNLSVSVDPVPNVEGLDRSAAELAIIGAGLSTTVSERFHRAVPTGHVISQDPDAGNVAANVHLVVSLGLPPERAIHNIDELQKIGNDPGYPLEGNYHLANDIDASATESWPGGHSGLGFEPIALNAGPDADAGFAGTFDGAGFVISGLFIRAYSSVGPVGLFSTIGDEGIVVNVGIVGGSITGSHDPTGALAGRNMGEVSNCHATDAVTIAEYGDAGGLVGSNYGTISNCHATGAVTGGSGAGGLVSSNWGTISECYATGTVASEEREVGGLVGRNEGHVSGSYATGTVTKGWYVGGLIGQNAREGTVTACYARGAVTGGSRTGGLVGDNRDQGAVSECYATGMVIGSNYEGGLIGAGSASRVTISFWDTETSGQATSFGGEGKTTAEMMMQGTFTGAGWDFTGIWTIVEGETYPYFLWQEMN